MVKYRQTYLDVVAAHKEEFEEFSRVHNLYKVNQRQNSKRFNEFGKRIREYLDIAVDRLCSKTEGSGKGVFSTNLSEKFWAEVKKDYPLIDFVGVEFS